MRARRELSVVALLGSALYLLPLATFAAPKIAPLMPIFSPEKAEEIVKRFHAAIAEGLKAAKMPTLDAEAVRSKVPRGCGAAACAERGRGRLGVSHVVFGRVETVGKNYKVELTLLPGGARSTGRCDICTLMEALTTTRKLAAKLGEEGRSTVLAAPTPAPRPARTQGAPARRPAPKPAPVAAKASLPATPPAAATTPETTPPAKTREPWPLWPTLVAGGVGIVGLAIGIPLLSMDGDFTNCRGTPLPDGRNCEDRYSTSGPGWVFTTMGLAGLATSGVLFYLYLNSRSERKSAQVAPQPLWSKISVWPTREGLLLNAAGTF